MKETFPKGARDELCNLLCNTIRENEEFMWNYARASYNEIAALSTDSIRVMAGAPPYLLVPGLVSIKR